MKISKFLFRGQIFLFLVSRANSTDPFIQGVSQGRGLRPCDDKPQLAIYKFLPFQMAIFLLPCAR